MTLRVLVVEDEPINREFIVKLIREAPTFSLLAACGDLQGACRALAKRPDIVLLDVQLGEGTGLDLLDDPAFSTLDPPPAVVFVTAYDRYAVAAFERHAVDYVLKPFGRQRLGAALARARQRLERDRARQTLERLQALVKSLDRGVAKRFSIKENGKTVLVPAESVDWVEAQRNYVWLHVAGRTHRLRRTLGELERELDPHGFVRTHRSALVNLHRVRALEPWFHGDAVLVMEGDQRVKLSRRYRAHVERRLSGG